MHTEAHLFSWPNDCLWNDKLWGPSQRVVTLLLLIFIIGDWFPWFLAFHGVWLQLAPSVTTVSNGWNIHKLLLLYLQRMGAVVEMMKINLPEKLQPHKEIETVPTWRYAHGLLQPVLLTMLS